MNTDAAAQRRFHGLATLFWAAITVPACLLIVFFREHEAAAIWTLVWLTFVSHYANFVGHWGAYQACKVEVRQDEIEVKREDEANVQVSGEEGDR